MRLKTVRLSVNDKKIVTTHVVRLKLFRLKSEGIQKVKAPHFSKKTANLRIRHALNVRHIPAFPNSLQSLASQGHFFQGTFLPE